MFYKSSRKVLFQSVQVYSGNIKTHVALERLYFRTLRNQILLQSICI